MPEETFADIDGFRFHFDAMYVGGIPRLLDETGVFPAFVTMLTATDTLAGKATLPSTTATACTRRWTVARPSNSRSVSTLEKELFHVRKCANMAARRTVRSPRSSGDTMNTSHKASREDLAFARAFEACEFAPEAFDHAAHVRLAYIYLCEASVDAAADRMKKSLQAFLAHLMVDPGKYHETITRAWIMAVAHFMQESNMCESAAEFMTVNHRLLDSKIMLKHYSAEVLFSPQAREEFVQPDVSRIPTS
ncbi:MAG: hypothetical protein AB7P31_14985 [Steroidobacteraceae bacterium]